MVSLLAGAQDAGGACSLAPVIQRLNRRCNTKVTVVAAGAAISVFEREQIAFIRLEGTPASNSALESTLEGILNAETPDALLVGTSWGPSVDKLLLGLAQAKGISSLALIDTWSWYRERFAQPGTQQLLLPTRIALMDPLAFDEAVRAGLPQSHLVVTGQPHFANLIRQFKNSNLVRQGHQLRNEWLPQSTNARIVLFASEAFARDFGSATAYYQGYTERDALDGLLEAVSKVRPEFSSAVVVRLHPSQAPEAADLPLSTPIRPYQLTTDSNPWACILAADVVVGMTSMLLLEAVIAGKPAISFQPGGLDPDKFIGARLQRIPVLTTVAELETALRKSLLESSENRLPLEKHHRADNLIVLDAAERVIEILLSLAGQQRF